MKKTNIINNFKLRLATGLLAAVTAFSTIAINFTKVSAAESNAYETAETISEYIDAGQNLLNRITDKDIEKMKKIGIQTVVAALGEFVPGGKTMGPAVQELLGVSFLDKQLSLDDINENINGLYSRIDQFENNMKDELKNILSLENFDYSIFTPFNSQIQGIVNAIKTAKASGVSTKQQYAIIAAQIDGDIEWKKSNSPFVGFTSVTKKLNNSNLVDGKDMFTIVYDYFKQRCMFSGEALDKTKEVIDGIMQNYTAGYSILLECLCAQLIVNALENKDDINPYYLSHISTNIPEILAKIAELNSVVIGTAQNGYLDKTGTVNEKYTRVLNTNRKIFINKGKNNLQLTGYLFNYSHSRLWDNKEDMAVGAFNQLVMDDKKHLSGDQIKDLANYAKGKNMTIRELLEANDIYTGHIPQNANLATSRAYDDFGAIDFLSAAFGSVHLHGLYKGINIDEKNPSEKEVIMWNHGLNGYGYDIWDCAEPGNAAIIEVA